MSKYIKFSYELCENIRYGNSTVTTDGSVISSLPTFGCKLSLYPFHWTFEILLSDFAEGKYKFECCLGNMFFLNYQTASLSIPPYTSGNVYMDVNFIPADGIYYSDYVDILEKNYYDPQKRIIAVGDLSKTEYCIEFVKGQYVVIDEQGRLLAAYVVLS